MDFLKELKHKSDKNFEESKLYDRIQGKNVVVFSASTGGKKIVKFLKYNNIKVEYVIDNNINVQNTYYEDIKIISPESVSQSFDLNNTVVLLGSITYIGEIRDQLLNLGFKRELLISPLFISDRFSHYLSDDIDDRKLIEENIEEIEKVIDVLEDKESVFVYKTVVQGRYENYLDSEKRYADIIISNQYFDKSIMTLTENEVFLDIGAYDGDSVKEFIKKVNNKYNKIYAFEPEDTLFKLLNENIEAFDRIQTVNKGLSNINGKLNFVSDDAGSRIAKDGDKVSTSIEVMKGDDFKIVPTYIKMDIEGEEIKALEGLERTIKEYKPKLAVCIYHRNEFKQLWEVPLYLKKLCSEYKITIRQHGYDTVCYATI